MLVANTQLNAVFAAKPCRCCVFSGFSLLCLSDDGSAYRQSAHGNILLSSIVLPLYIPVLILGVATVRLRQHETPFLLLALVMLLVVLSPLAIAAGLKINGCWLIEMFIIKPVGNNLFYENVILVLWLGSQWFYKATSWLMPLAPYCWPFMLG